MAKIKLKFAELLTTAVRTIAAQENKAVANVQDELGYALGRETGGSCIEYWRKGHIPADHYELEELARELVKRNGLDQTQCKQFLQRAGHPNADEMLNQLFLFLDTRSSRSELSSQELSPFVVGPPITTPRQFFGRKRELNRIFSLWQFFPLQHVAILGPKRSGKTSLLHYLKSITCTSPAELRPGQRTDWLPNPERYQWVLVDFQDTRMVKRERLLRYLLTSLNMPAPELCNLDTFMDIMSHYLQEPTVILMDEIGAGLASSELDEPFWWSLRSLVSHHTGGNLAFVLTSHGPPDQLAQDHGKPSPFFNIFNSLELGPFSELEANELIVSSPQPFTSADNVWILEQSGRWPSLMQILCQARLLTLAEGDSGNSWRDGALRQMEPFHYLLKQ